MKVRSATQLGFLVTVAWCLGSALWAQSGSPGIAVGGASTGMSDASQICFANGTFLVTGRDLHTAPGGTTATSPDGLHWTVHTVSNSVSIGVNRGTSGRSNNFVAFGCDGPAPTNGLIQFSPDGVVWGEPVTIPSTPINGVAYDQGTYVAVGESGGAAAVVTSADGVHWNTRTFPGNGPLYSIATGGGTFVAVGDSGVIVTSTNGSDWQARVVLPGASIYSVAYGMGMFVAVTQPPALPSSMLVSTNGMDWAILPYPLVDSLGYGNGLFVGITDNIYASTNLFDWIYASTNLVDPTRVWSHPGAADVVPVGVAYGAGTFCILITYGGMVTVRPGAFLGWTGQTNGVVDLTLTGGWLGQSCRLQAATNLPPTNWVDLLTFTNQGSVTPIQDVGASNYSQRFYRVAMP
jgi:hypothetical protein